MEYLKKIQAAFSVEHMAHMRVEQLHREGKIDEQLKVCATTCPEQVIRYFMNMRQLNRIHTNKIHKKGLLDSMAHMKHAYKDTRYIQRMFWQEHQFLEKPINNTYHIWDYSDGNRVTPSLICSSLLPWLNNQIETGLSHYEKHESDPELPVMRELCKRPLHPFYQGNGIVKY